TGIEYLHCTFAEDNVKLAYILHQVLQMPYTFKMHAHDLFSEPHEGLLRWAMSAHKVLTISEYNRRYLRTRLKIPRERIEVVSDGIDLARTQPVTRYQRSPFTILSVARLVEMKGLPYLIEACQQLKEKGIAARCVIYGEGPQAAALQQQIEACALQDRV